MIDELKQNINTETEILREISNYFGRMKYASPSERELMLTAINSLRASAKMINSSIPKMLEDITIVKKLPRKESVNKQLEKVEFKRLDSRIHVTLNIEDKEKFFKELSISEDLVKGLRKTSLQKEDKSEEIKSTRAYLKISNKLFLGQAVNLIGKGYFKSLALTLRKANIEILISSYVACMIFSTVLSFFLSLFLSGFLFFFKLQLTFPFITIYGGEMVSRIFQIFWIPIIIPPAVFFLMFMYPSFEKDSLSKKIDQELPFVVINMSAISTSGIEPSEIFKIIAVSKEYPYMRKEIRKVLNQINLYGYDLVAALNNVSRSAPSPRLADLLAGISVTITSGGDLSKFFEKRAETLLVTYRLDREKYTRSAETFMDIYISVVIAAPMILMVLMIMMQFSKIGPSFSVDLIVLMVSVINIFFLVILDIKQPIY
jgi:flagellar protein FlaJ